MVKPLIFLAASLLLLSCSANEDSRYRDTSRLELPPALLNPQPVKAENTDTEVDEATVDEKAKGLGDDVYLSEAKPTLLKLKQPLDIAWNTVESALRQGDFDIKDRELDKGQYYVIFDPDQYADESDTVVDRFGSLFVNDYSKSTYLLTLTADGGETLITADKAQSSEQNASDEEQKTENADADEKSDGPDKLLLSLYRILHDELNDQ